MRMRRFEDKVSGMTEGRCFLSTPRLRFRLWSPADLPLALGLWGNADVARFISAGGSMSDREVAARLAQEIACQTEHGISYWPIFLRADGAHVGCCGLRPYRPRDYVHELGVHIRPEHWRKGLAFEAAQAVISHAFDHVGSRALFAGHHPSNHGSREMLMKLGFRYTHDELCPPTGVQHPSYRLSRPG